MDGEIQKLLSDYVKKGGYLILYPVIPTLDLYLHPCSVLKGELKIQFTKSISSNKVDAYNIEDVFTLFNEKLIFQAEKSEIVAKTKMGEVCGMEKKVGKGNITVLGFAFGYSSDEHLLLLEKILSRKRIKRQAKVSDPDIQFVIRKGNKCSYLFLLNYHNKKKTFKVNAKEYTLNSFSFKVVKMK